MRIFYSLLVVLLCYTNTLSFAETVEEKGARLNAEIIYNSVHNRLVSTFMEVYGKEGLKPEEAQMITSYSLSKIDVLALRKEFEECLYASGLSSGKIEEKSDEIEQCEADYVEKIFDEVSLLEEIDMSEAMLSYGVTLFPSLIINNLIESGYLEKDVEPIVVTAFGRLDLNGCVKDAKACLDEDSSEESLQKCLQDCSQKYLSLVGDVISDYSIETISEENIDAPAVEEKTEEVVEEEAVETEDDEVLQDETI